MSSGVSPQTTLFKNTFINTPFIENIIKTTAPYLPLIILALLVFYIYNIICLAKIAQKTGTKKAWFAWVPILDLLLATRIARKPAWWIFLFFIPLINLAAFILVWMGISRALNKPGWLGLLTAITPINLIIPGYLAFSSTCDKPTEPKITVVSVSF